MVDIPFLGLRLVRSSIEARGPRVDTPCAAYEEMACNWLLPRTLMGGTKAMREAAETYLPRETGESEAEYKSRLNRTVLFNAFRRTVYNVNGKVFSKPIAVGEGVDPQIKDWYDNVDLAGRNLDTFASDVFIDGWQAGMSHVLVDMQQRLNTVDAAGRPRPPTQAEAAGRRPYFVHVKAENLIGWRVETINGVPTLTQIRIRECVTVPDGDWGEAVSERIRVIWPDRFVLYEKDANGNGWIEIASGPMTLGKIALKTFYVNRTGFMKADVPLQDLADLNVAHWQSSSDQRNILHVARVPILFRAGFGSKEGGVQEVGANRMFTAADANAKMEYVEHTGQAIGSGRTDLLDVEDRMRVMGLELFINRPGNPTATGRAIDSNESNSTVRSSALGLQDCLQGAAGLMAEWSGKDADKAGSLAVNTDYGISLRDAADIDGLIRMRMAGEISRETFWAECQRRGFLSDGFDSEKEQIRLDDEMPDGDLGDDLLKPGEEPGDGQRDAA